MTAQHQRPLTRMDIRLGYVAARVGVTYDDKTCWAITDALVAVAPLETWSVEAGQVVTTADPDFWAIVTDVVGA